MKVTDITQQLLSARTRAEKWTESALRQVISEVIQALPESNLNWDDEAGEEWGQISSEKKLAVILRVDFPFCFAHQSFQLILQPIFERHAVVTVYFSDWETRDIQIDPRMVKTLFGRDLVAYEVDPARLSIAELWWATI
jgi:hypothetical protein